MLWYNILNPRAWPGVNIKTGNNKIDGVYYNLLSSNHVSLAASGSMFLAANSGIQLISPSFVGASGIKCTRILAENYGKINNTGGIIPLYSGEDNGVIVKLDDNNVYSTNIITYDQESDELRFPSANDGSVLYTVPFFISQGSGINPTKKISSFDQLSLQPRSTDTEGAEINAAAITFSAKTFANSGLSIGPNNFLESYKGFILTHDGSGNVAQWKPATYLRENYDLSAPLEGLERIGINWIRYPRRPALLLNGKLYLYQIDRSWSAYPAFNSIAQIKKELGIGSDTLCVTKAVGEATVGYTKFAFVEKGASQQKIESVFDFDDRITQGTVVDPDAPTAGSTPCWIIDIAPEDPGGISDNSPGTNVSIFSVTKGAYFPMQIEPLSSGNIRLRTNSNSILSGVINSNDDGTLLDSPQVVNLGFKPSTLNNISIRPEVHTAFNMLGENIDFLIYGKENTPFNTYNNTKFELNENLIPGELTPIFKIDATIPNSIQGTPTGVIYSKFSDREKKNPIGWSFDYSGKVCIKTKDSYVLGSVASGTGFLQSHADVTISGHTYTTSLIAEDIYLKPIPNRENSEKYKRNALLTVDNTGKIISRMPRINPTVPGIPSGVAGVVNGFAGQGNLQHSIAWTAPENDGNSRIINYLIQASFNDGNNWLDISPTTTPLISLLRGFDTQTSATIEQVSQNVIFRVAAQNGVGIGEYSEATENTFVSNTGVPRSPLNFIAERNIDNIDLSDISLSWDASTSWGSSSPSGYLIEESSNDGFSWFSVAFVPHDEELSYNDTGLDGITNYLYRISARNTSNGISSYNYVYSTGLLLFDPDLEEEENRRQDELSNFDFNNILFTGICNIS